jgi:hypothetical protein
MIFKKRLGETVTFARGFHVRSISPEVNETFRTARLRFSELFTILVQKNFAGAYLRIFTILKPG